MNEKITVEDGNLVIRVPMLTYRSNPYMGDDWHPEMDNIIGLYEDEYNNGLCYRIDMDYKGKSDQYSDYFFKLDGDREEFDALIEKLKIDAVYCK